MALFDEISKKVGDIAYVTARKSKQLTEIAKYNIAIRNEENNIKRFYQKLGKLYFEEFGTSAPEPFADICEDIVSSKKNILLQRDKLTEIKNMDDIYEEGIKREKETRDATEYTGSDICNEDDTSDENDGL